jgi:hypothetical protein
MMGGGSKPSGYQNPARCFEKLPISVITQAYQLGGANKIACRQGPEWNQEDFY